MSVDMTASILIRDTSNPLFVSGSFDSLIRAESIGNRFLIYNVQHNQWQHELQALQQTLIESDCDSMLILNDITYHHNEIHIEMTVLEKDGSISNFCGNGARAVCRFLRNFCPLSEIKNMYFETPQGPAKVVEAGEDRLAIDMGKPHSDLSGSRYFNSNSQALVLFENELSSIHLNHKKCFFVDALEPHLYCFDPMTNFELIELGKYINLMRNIFPEGINVNHVIWQPGEADAKICTYERGVNDLTRACGTGATGLAYLLYVKSTKELVKFRITSLGGELEAQALRHNDHVVLSGEY